MSMKINKRIIAAVLFAAALCLIGLTLWDGMYQAGQTARAQIMKQLAGMSDYASHHVCMYFNDLMHLSSNVASMMPQEGSILDDGVMHMLKAVCENSGADEIIVAQAYDGRYASTRGYSGTTDKVRSADAYGLGSVTQYNAEGRNMICVSTPILRQGRKAGVLAWLYAADTISREVSINSLAGSGSFHVFQPGGDYVFHSAAVNKPESETAVYPLRDMEFADGFSFAALAADVKAGRSNVVEYLLPDGQHMLGHYILLGINDWYIMSVLPESVLRQNMEGQMGLILFTFIKFALLACMVGALIYEIMRSRVNRLKAEKQALETRVRKQAVALAALGMPPFEFDMHTIAARMIDPNDRAHEWLRERILIPEHSGEVVDPRDESAYLKLCNAMLNARGVLSGDFRLRTAPDKPMRMYRMVLSVPEHTDETDCTIVTLIDLDDVSQRIEALRLRASRDAITGLNTLSEFRIRSGNLLERPMHHFGAVAVIRSDNTGRVLDAADMPQDELLLKCSALICDALAECDVFARGVGSEYWVFSGDPTGLEIIQKGISPIMDSGIGADDAMLTFSCGIAHADPTDSIDDIMARADAAARTAHKEGGHRVQHG